MSAINVHDGLVVMPWWSLSRITIAMFLLHGCMALAFPHHTIDSISHSILFHRPHVLRHHPSFPRLGFSPLHSHTDPHSVGDALRAQTGIRPSLHPTTINALSQAILLYYQPSLDPTLPMKVTTHPPTTPLQVAIAAGTLAWNAIELRHRQATPNDRDDVFTPEEAQVISGRVVGVVLRMTQLESMLVSQVHKAPWVAKYQEYGMFGLCSFECSGGDTGLEDPCSQQIQQDPLLRMNRAECLLALFIRHVEIPGLAKAGVEAVVGGSRIDFMDQERLQVLFDEEK